MTLPMLVGGSTCQDHKNQVHLLSSWGVSCEFSATDACTFEGAASHGGKAKEGKQVSEKTHKSHFPSVLPSTSGTCTYLVII